MEGCRQPGVPVERGCRCAGVGVVQGGSAEPFASELAEGCEPCLKRTPATGGDILQQCMQKYVACCKAAHCAKQSQDDFRARSISCRSFKVVELSFCYIRLSILYYISALKHVTYGPAVMHCNLSSWSMQ